MSEFENVSDEGVFAIMHRAANQCVRVTSMPTEQQTSAGLKGAATPQMGGWLAAVAALRARTELVRRGLLPAELPGG